MKTKYTKVSVSEITPQLEQIVIGIGYTGEISRMTRQENGYWQSLEHECECDEPEFWLEESADIEEDMKEMLESIMNTTQDKALYFEIKNLLSNAQNNSNPAK